MTHRLLLGLLIPSILLLACGREDAADTPQPAPVLYTEKDDPEMSAAVQRARSELATFEQALRSPTPGQSGFGAKVAVPHTGGSEHIWIGSPVFEADSIVGTVESAPLYAKQVTQGSRIRVDRDAISDWMYMENGALRGGYTMRVAIDRLPADQRDAQRKAYGIEEGGREGRGGR